MRMAKLLWTCGPIAFLLLPAGAFAQSGAPPRGGEAASGEAGGWNDVVVTARKRAERLQDVPESVSVVSGDLIEKANITNLHQYAAVTPNMLVRSTFRSNETFITMRGISSAQNALPPVSIIVDGVQLGSNDFINQDLLDVERIEILRGPQGALYGQGAIAGAINIISRPPTDEMTGMVKANIGNGLSHRVAGSLSGPIVPDMLGFRVSAMHRGSEGLIRNVRGDKVDSNQQTTLRGLLKFESGPFSTALRGSWTDGGAGCCIQDKAPRDAAGNFVDLDDVTNPGPSSNVLGRENTRFSDASARFDYDAGPVTLTAISGFAHVDQGVFADLDYSAAPTSVQNVNYRSNVFNQDLRIASNGDGAFGWIVGGYYQRRRSVSRLMAGPDATPFQPTLLNQDIYNTNRSWAAYVQTTWSPVDRLELLAALRYDRVHAYNINRLSPAATRASANFKSVQPKVQASWKWTPDIMMYATFSKGFRTGGFSQTTLFDNENTYNYEFGFKTQFADGRVTINGSLFHIDYENQQLSYGVTTSTTLIRRTINIPKTRNDGFELEMQLRPTDRLTANISVGAVDSVISKVAPDPFIPTSGAVGKKSPLVPPLTMSAVVTHRTPVAQGLELVAVGTAQHRGGFYFDVANSFYTRTKTFLDANLSIEADNWSFGLWGKNLTNARFTEHISITGADLRFPNQPRTWGAEAVLRF